MEYIIIGAVIVGFIIFKLYEKRKDINKFKKRYKKNYTKKGEKLTDDQIKYIKSYYNLNNNDFKIDDITVNDLEIDNIFELLNKCKSSIGEEYLYNLITTPIEDEEELDRRNRIIRRFAENFELSQQIALILRKMSKDRSINSSQYIFGDRGETIPQENKYLIGFILAVVSILAAIFIPQGFIILIFVFVFNIMSYYRNKNFFSAHLFAVNEILKLVDISKKLVKIKIKDTDKEVEDVKIAVSKIKKKFGFLANFMYSSEFFLFEYLKIFFQFEFLLYRKMAKEISQNRHLFQLLYNYVGFIDAVNSLGEYFSNKDVSIPKLSYDINSIEFEDAYHPMIDEPISNSLVFNKPILLTGSNATGKSTFLKTVAVNQLFAQTVKFVFAKEYIGGIFKIYTSMALRDSMETNESYYLKEISSIKRIIEAKDNDTNILCFIDEVLRGTNTVERIAASSQLLKYFKECNFLCMAATHDIELTYILENTYENYHFKESVIADELIFDYLLKKGRSNTRNAISLLRIYGFSNEIVENAHKMAEEFENNDKWILI